MKQSEFNSWLAYHGVSFPSFALFVDRVSIETLEQWRGITVGCTLDAMRQATDLMLAGQMPKPFRDEDHVTALAAKARSLAAAMAPVRDNRERVCRCPLCVDSAYVTVMSDSTVERAQRGEYDAYAAWFRQGRRGRPPARLKWYSWALWCGCPIGERQRQLTQNGYARLPVYNPDRHVRLIEDEAAMIDEAKRLKPANYVEAFADWNTER